MSWLVDMNLTTSVTGLSMFHLPLENCRYLIILIFRAFFKVLATDSSIGSNNEVMFP